MSKNVVVGVGHVFYPESCPIENIENFILPNYNVACSPLHDRDKKADGTLKKPHYHLLFIGKLSEKDKRYIEKITGMKHFESLYDLKQSYYYLYHWDGKTNWFIKNKAQYWSADIKKGELFDYDVRNDDSSENNNDYFSCMLNDLQCLHCFQDFFLFINNSNDEKYKEYCLKYHSFISNYYRNNGNTVFDREDNRYDINKANRRRKREFYNDENDRAKYSVECDENDFLKSEFISIDT